MNEIIISQVSRQDLPEVLALAHDVVESDVSPHLTAGGQHFLLASLAKDINNIIVPERYHALKACQDNELLGYIAWRNNNHIAQFYVKSAYQGNGVGSRLLRELLT